MPRVSGARASLVFAPSFAEAVMRGARLLLLLSPGGSCGLIAHQVFRFFVTKLLISKNRVSKNRVICY